MYREGIERVKERRWSRDKCKETPVVSGCNIMFASENILYTIGKIKMCACMCVSVCVRESERESVKELVALWVLRGSCWLWPNTEQIPLVAALRSAAAVVAACTTRLTAATWCLHWADLNRLAAQLTGLAGAVISCCWHFRHDWQAFGWQLAVMWFKQQQLGGRARHGWIYGDCRVAAGDDGDDDRSPNDSSKPLSKLWLVSQWSNEVS